MCIRDSLGLLLHLLAVASRIGQQRDRIALARGGRATLADRALEPGQGLGRSGLHVAAVEATALAGVACRSGRLHHGDEGVVVAVVAQRLEALDVPGRLALVPQLAARTRPEPHLAARAASCGTRARRPG